jgi:4-hydroxy-tetrahydrodipicolinate reductase
MKIGLLGYGKMGKEIEAIALQRNHTVPLKVDEHNRITITDSDIKACNVLIDFSTPHGVMGNIHFAVNAGVPLVVGTTGWHDSIHAVGELVKNMNGSLIYGSNFSVGVNIFFALNQYLANIMDRYPDYDPAIHEIHHTQKLDAPSGTAITLGKDIIEKLKKKNKWVNYLSGKQDELSITADRIENVPGTHIVTYSSEVDTIELKHIAHNRKGFALGAVLAAEWIVDKKGFYEVKEMFGF